MGNIGHASSDEVGKYSGGKAGDQTGKEVCVRTWYSRPWNVVMWAKDPDIREKMAQAMEKACANDNIGYDQGTTGNGNDRYTLYNAAKKVNFDLSKVKVACETDCSNLVAVCANAAGVNISPYIYTGNEKQAFKNTGLFEIHTEKEYTQSCDNIPRGAVLLYEGHHTAINLDNGKNWIANIQGIPVCGTVEIVNTGLLNTRKGPGTNYNIITQLKCGDKIDIIQKYKPATTWWFETNAGWISGNYIEGIIKEISSDNKSWIVHKGYSYKTSTIEDFLGNSYCIDKDGWIITPDRLNQDGSIK